MRTFLVSLMVVLASFTFTVDYAEAKRLGGGSSFGKSFSTPKKKQVAPAPTQQKQSTATTASKTQQPVKKRSGFGGLMAGLLAGGLLGALFFGGAFEGIQFMDILLLLAFVFIAFKIFSMFRKSQRPPEYATDGAQYEMRPERAQKRTAFEEPKVEDVKPSTPAFSSGFGSGEPQTPEWFDKEAFLAGARDHFGILQRAWDNSDWDEIASYTSEELLNALKEERAKLPESQTTEVVSVMAEMANFITEDDHVVVSINFYGWLKEDSDQTTEFNEIWHLTRDMTVENADWIIVGIEQPR
ncbi:Tim44 domain-containing protein [Pontibacterium sp.]|uniref:Tim44 domain-containing protein n=1 Tax=Pontibacterium sp. TaxID=2036026 RepID=UPI003515C73A